MNNKRVELKDIVYLIIYAAIFILGIPTKALIKFKIEIPNYFLVLVIYSFAAILGYIMYKKDFIYDLLLIKGKIKKGILLAIKIAFMMWAINIAVVLLMNNIYHIDTTTNQSAIYNILKQNAVMMFLPMIVLGPFVEELIFRHIIIGKFSYKFSKTIMIIISSLIFAFLHTGFSIEIIIYLPMALALSYLYIKTKENFAATFLFHMSWNLLGFLASILIIKLDNFI